MRRELALLTVAVLVTTAGCSAFGSGSDNAADREPYGVDDAVRPAHPELVPGLTADGVTDRIALRNAHFEALENESYALATRSTVRNDSGVVHYRERTQTVADGAAEQVLWTDPQRMDVDHDGIVTIHVWRRGGEAYTRYEDVDEEIRYEPDTAHPITPGLPFSLLEAYEIVDDVHPLREGYALSGTGAIHGNENASIDLLLADDGVVEEFWVELERTGRGEKRRAAYVGSVDRGDGFDVAEPDWLEEARARFEDE